MPESRTSSWSRAIDSGNPRELLRSGHVAPSGHEGRLHSDSRSKYFSLLDLLSVRFIATTKDTPVFRNGEPPGWRRVFAPAKSRLEVYENANPLPRAYVVTRPEWRDGRQAALLALTRPDFDPRRVVVLEGGPRPEVTATSSDDAGFAPAHIASYTPRRVVRWLNFSISLSHSCIS